MTGSREFENDIILSGLRVHNLQDIDIRIPIGKTTVITGVSGAGKSSLVFDTLYAEAHRRYLQSLSPQLRAKLEQNGMPEFDQIANLPTAIAIHRRGLAKAQAMAGRFTTISDSLENIFCKFGVLHCFGCQQPLRSEASEDIIKYYKNLPSGLTVMIGYPQVKIPEETWSDTLARLREDGFIRVFVNGEVHRTDQTATDLSPKDDRFIVLLDRLNAGQGSLQRVSDAIETAKRMGNSQVVFIQDDKIRTFSSQLHCTQCRLFYPPLQPQLLAVDLAKPCKVCEHAHGPTLQQIINDGCSKCGDGRLSRFIENVIWHDHSINSLSSLEIGQLLQRLNELPTSENANLTKLLVPIRRRLRELCQLGLAHITLSRDVATIPGGDMVRMQLGNILSNPFVQGVYLLDEPSAGLHPCQINDLMEQLKQLKQDDCTLVMIEHNPALIESADHRIHLGPGAGSDGGKVCYVGLPNDFSPPDEPTSTSTDISLPNKENHLRLTIHRRNGSTELRNLKDAKIDIPLGRVCVVTGVSGAGKTTLLRTIFSAFSSTGDNSNAEARLHQEKNLAIEEVVFVEQASDIMGAQKTIVAIVIKVFDLLRKLFAETNEAKVRNLNAASFGLSAGGGRCEYCQGQGTVKVDMDFLADIQIQCPECAGKRFNSTILGVKFRSLDISEVLEMTLREAFRFFRAQTKMQKKLQPYIDMGLEHLRLGQSLATLSVGELRRLKMAETLATKRNVPTLFLLDEPATGLHAVDVAKVLECLQRLIQTGHSVVLADNHLHFVRHAHHMIEMGPGCGENGGAIILAGAPQDLKDNTKSQIGPFL